MLNTLNYEYICKKILIVKKTLVLFFKNTLNFKNLKLSFFLITDTVNNLFTKNNFLYFIFFLKLNILRIFNLKNIKNTVKLFFYILMKVATFKNTKLVLQYLYKFLNYIFNSDVILKACLELILIILKDFLKLLFIKIFNTNNLKIIKNFCKFIFYFLFNWRKIYKGSKNFIKWAIIDVFNIVFTVNNFAWLIKFIFKVFKKTFYFIFNSKLFKFLRKFFNFRVVRHITYFTDLWKGVLSLWLFFIIISTKIFNVFFVKNILKNEELCNFIIENCKYPVTITYYPLYKYGMYILIFIVIKLFKLISLFFFFLPLDFELIDKFKFFVFNFVYIKYLSVDLFVSRKIAFCIINFFFYLYCFYKFKQTIFSKGWVVFKK